MAGFIQGNIMRSVLQTPQPLVVMLFAGLASAPTFASKGLGGFLFFSFLLLLFQLTNFMEMWWDAMVGLRSLPSSFLFARCGNNGSLGLWWWWQYRTVHTEQCSTELREIFRTGYKQDTSLRYGMIGNLRMMWYFAAEMFERFTVRYFSQCYCSAGSPTQLCGELEIKVRREFLFFLSFLLRSWKLGKGFFHSPSSYPTLSSFLPHRACTILHDK